MFLNHIKFYVRSLFRRKLFSFINITGLAFAIAFMLLIGQFVYYESTYNRDIENVDNIYRLANVSNNNYSVDYRMRDILLDNLTTVKNAGLYNHFTIEASTPKHNYPIDNFIITDSHFFEILNVQFIAGDPREALSTIDGVVLTESTAKQIFGTTDIIGKAVKLSHKFDMVVTGVIKDLPDHINIKGDMFASWLNTPKERIVFSEGTMIADGKEPNVTYPFNIILELKNNRDKHGVEKFIEKYGKIDSFKYPEKAKLMPLKDDYYDMQYSNYDFLHGNIELVRILSIIGFVVLFLAAANFINLATASYRYRMNEIGIKKCFGADRKSMIKQFLLESLFTCIISALIGVILAEIFLPYFNQYVDKSISLQIYSDQLFLLIFVSFIILLSFITGFLPAVVLSRVTPLQIFKLNPYLKGTGKHYRGIFTVFQFVITTVMIISLIVITRQIDFVKHRDLGFNTDKLLYLKVDYTMGDRIKPLMDKLKEFHGIKSITSTFGMPGKIYNTRGEYNVIQVDSTSLSTFGFKIVKGRNLMPGDVDKACLINYSAFKRFDDKDFRNHKAGGLEIVGVVSDFNYKSSYNTVEPLALIINTTTPSTLTMRLTGPVGQTIKYIENTWNEMCPDYTLDYGFYDEMFASMYEREDKFASLITMFSLLAIVISCLGIFGLSVFQSEQKIKEIGIRKVLGASVSEITFILTKNFSMWVIIADIIAFPVAYFLMKSWLQDFAFKIELNWWIFLLSGLIAITIALFTISWQAIKAATANPVEALRYE